MKLEKDKKWKWPAEKMREWTDDELSARDREFSERLFRLKFQMAGGQSESLVNIRELRKGIARLKTVLRERELKTSETKPV
jgi:large subunit ribosomal protein L29